MVNNLVAKLAHFVIASSYLRAYKALPTPVRRRYLCAYKAPKKHLFRRLQIKVRPKGLHSFTFSTLNFKFSSTTVEDSLQINSFMQNEPNLPKAQMNVNKVLTNAYEEKTLGEHGENEPKTNPIKAKQSQFQTAGRNYDPERHINHILAQLRLSVEKLLSDRA